MAEPPLPPTFAFIKTPRWERVEPDAKDAFAELCERLGDRVENVELVQADDAYGWHEAISGPEVALNLRREWEHGRDGLSKALQGRIERGRAVPGHEYLAALARVPAFVMTLKARGSAAGVFGRDVKLPAKLADISPAGREHRRIADADFADRAATVFAVKESRITSSKLPIAGLKRESSFPA